jgi:crotonobetaine/carnitine-CoA ligase
VTERTGPQRAELAPNAVAGWAADTPDATFLEHVDGRRLAYRDVDGSLDLWASALTATGLAPAERVASFVTDPIDAAIVWLATGRAGLVAVPLNTAHVGRMLRHVLVTSDAAALVVSSDLLDRLPDVLVDLPTLRLVIVLGDELREGPELHTATVHADDVLAVGTRHDFDGPDLHDTAMLLFTSGTTGPSKAVAVPWAGAHGYWSWVPEDTVGAGEGLYAPMTMFHISGLGALQAAAWRGSRLVTRDRFSAQAFWDDTRRTGAVAAGLVGPMTALLAAAPPRADDAENPLRGVILGPMIAEMTAFERRFGVKVATCYGMTEVPPVIATGWDHGPWETCGRPIDGYPWPEARIVDAHDRELPLGEVGELIVRTSAPWTLNAGYFGDPAATASAWRNGWFHTGDAFRRDETGWFYFVDRMTDTIRRRGENISSFEVEHVVLEHPAVEACAAFGVADPFGGHEVMVAVVPKPGRDLAPRDLGAYLADQLPKYMIPRYIDLLEELPRNTTSLRVQKFVLRDRGVSDTTWDRLAED